tara:strand:+ start:2267 stop:2458 length:192 start_codon:yes stop_codon:yes gene_type:complete
MEPTAVNDNLYIIHIVYVAALVFFVFRNADRHGRRNVIEMLLNDKIVTEKQLTDKYSKHIKKK